MSLMFSAFLRVSSLFSFLLSYSDVNWFRSLVPTACTAGIGGTGEEGERGMCVYQQVVVTDGLMPLSPV